MSDNKLNNDDFTNLDNLESDTLYLSDEENEVVESENQEMDIDLDTSVDDLDLGDNSDIGDLDIDISDDLEKFEIDNSMDHIESIEELDSNSDEADETESLANTDFEIDSDFDLSFDEDTSTSDINELSSEDTGIADSIEIDSAIEGSGTGDFELSSDNNFELDSGMDMDIKDDLGLSDELQLSGESIENTDTPEQFDFIDDTGSAIENIDSEYGVDLKSGPETIAFTHAEDGFFSDDNLLDESVLEEKFNQDESIVKLNIPEKENLEIDDDQNDFLTSEGTEPLTDLDTEIDQLSLDSLEEEALDKAKTNNLVTDEEISGLELNSSPLDLSEDQIELGDLGDISLSENGTIEETEDHLTLDESEDLAIDDAFQDQDMDKIDINLSDEDLELSDFNEKELKDMEVDLDISEPGTGDIPKQDDLTMEELNLDTLEEDDKIKLDESELSLIEDTIFPADEDMPMLDEDIASESLDINEGGLSNSISPLADSGSVLTDNLSSEITDEEPLDSSLSGDLELESLTEEITEDNIDNMDLNNIPKPSVDLDQDLEDMSIGLSGDELDNILSNTDIIESTEIDTSAIEKPPVIDDSMELEDETVTIDLDHLEAELNEVPGGEESSVNQEEVQVLNISASEEEEIYQSLKDDMKKQKEGQDVELKEEVKQVLGYLDQLLDALPEDKIKEFAESKAFDLYRKLFEDLKIKH